MVANVCTQTPGQSFDSAVLVNESKSPASRSRMKVNKNLNWSIASEWNPKIRVIRHTKCVELFFVSSQLLPRQRTALSKTFRCDDDGTDNGRYEYEYTLLNRTHSVNGSDIDSYIVCNRVTTFFVVVIAVVAITDKDSAHLHTTSASRMYACGTSHT